MEHDAPIQIDTSLAARIEAAEAQGTKTALDAWIATHPDSGMETRSLPPGLATCAIESSPGYMRRAMALGFDDPSRFESQLDEAQAFFARWSQPCIVDLSPFADEALVSLLAKRGYLATAFNSVMIARAEDIASQPQIDYVSVRAMASDEIEHYASLSHEAFRADGDAPEPPDVYRLMFSQPGATAFVAEIDGRPVGTGMVALHQHDESIASLFGGCTLQGARRQGVHAAIVRERARFGVDHGCEYVVVVGATGKGTERTARRLGFCLAYTKVRMERSLPE